MSTAVEFSSQAPAWVVGLDGSDNSRHAAVWAAQHAPGRTSELQLVSAWHVPAGSFYPVGAALSVEMSSDIEAATSAAVKRTGEELAAATDVPVISTAVAGGAARVLLEAAGEDGVLIVGSRGHGGFARLVLGSTSSQLAAHALVPTVIVPHDAPVESVDHIVVAVDGSPNSLAALDWAIAFAPPEAKVQCVMVWEIAAPVGEQSWPPASPDEVGVHRRFVEVIDQRTSNRPDIEVEKLFIEGAPRQELQRLAASADLLVMGVRGHGAIGAALLGSVSMWLLHHVHRPMVVVPG